MTWAGQIGHIVAKDLRQARWFLLAYFAIVALATARALEWIGTSGRTFEMVMFSVVIVGMFVTAYFVQADSPVRSDAFWGSRPFSAGAMLSAKLMAAAIVILLPAVIGQLASLVDSGLAVTTVLKLVAESVWMYAIWLLIAAVTAALTSDLRGFTTALVLGLILSIIGSEAFDRVRWPTSQSTQTLVSLGSSVVGVSAALGLLSYLYRNRTSSPVAWVIAGASAATMMIAVLDPWPTSSVQATGPVAELPPSVRFRIGTTPQPGGEPSVLAVSVDGVQSSRLAVSLASPIVALRLRDGKTIEVPLQTPRLRLTREASPLEPSIRVAGYPDVPSRYTRTVALNPRQDDALHAGIVGATIKGYLTSLRSEVDMTLPLRAGALERHDGYRMQVITVNRADKDSLAKVSLSVIGGSDDRQRMGTFYTGWWEVPQFVLINEPRAEAVIASVGENGSSSNALVLPGAWRTARTLWLQLPSRFGEAEKDDEWLANARIGLISWTPLHERYLEVSATVAPPQLGALPRPINAARGARAPALALSAR